jgi:myo-inositol 2-dehydrogenase / D-chiro-inositol 1-dehydrogenase
MGKERARSVVASGATVVAVADGDRGRAEELASAHDGCRVAESGADVIRASPDAVFICTPPSTRTALELLAIESRIALFVEKPIGVGAEHAESVLSRLEASGIVNAVGYHNRCRTSVEHARRVLKGRTILALCVYWVGRKYLVPWWAQADESGGPINEQATHIVDLCRHLCGEIASVTGAIGSVNGEPDEASSAAVTLRFTSGAFGSFFYSCEATTGKQIGIRIITPAGGITLSDWDLTLTHNDIDGSGVSAAVDDIFARETKRFLDAVSTRDPSAVACNYADAWATQRVVDRIRRLPGTA